MLRKSANKLEDYALVPLAAHGRDSVERAPLAEDQVAVRL
jgi:hypothetical protein